jgi:phosphate starvation-inducible PhoH-like protein
MHEKILPYLRPLYDALYDMMEVPRIRGYEEQGIIEIAPLAYMRGRTLNNAFIILDEAQNATREQMKMFLTRLGLRSRMVINGDVTQIDLPGGDKVSGLVHARSVLQGVEGVAFVYLTEQDVVRHDIVQRIILAYEAAERTPSPPAEK